MTFTVMELIANLKIYPGDMVVTIKDVDDQEFEITDFESENNTLPPRHRINCGRRGGRVAIEKAIAAPCGIAKYRT